MLNQLKNAVNDQNIKMVSFDIFDTLLIQPFANPDGIFSLIEINEHKKGFKEARIKAEKISRKTSSGGTTLNQIYSNIQEKYKNLLNVEINYEIDNTFVNDETKEFFDYCIKKNIPVIITSDTYLPKKIILEILNKNSIVNFVKLYLLPEHTKATHDSNDSSLSLFQEIIKDFNNLKPNEILHIGNSLKYYIQKASKYGIKIFHYPSLREQFIAEYPRANLLDISIPQNNFLLGKLLIAWKKSDQFKNLDYWGKIGFFYSGVFCLTFTNFINEISLKENIDKILFVARDGYTIKKVYNILYNTIDSEYIYCPRSFKKYINNKEKTFNFHSYLNYKNNNSKNIAIVDTIAENYSSQLLISKISGKEYTGIYWTSTKRSDLKYHSIVISESNKDKDDSLSFRNWNFIEFLITSPEAPISGMKGYKPKYKDNISDFEKYRMSIYPSIDKGACLLAKKIKELSINTPESIESTVTWINLFLETPSKEDIKQFNNVRFASDSSHNKYLPLLCKKKFLHDGDFDINIIKNLLWKSPLQSTLVNIMRPIHFSLTKRKIIFFPYSKKGPFLKIFSWTVSIGSLA